MALIRKLLANYAILEEGRMLVHESGYADYWGPRMSGRHSQRSPFEVAAMIKTDIDRAIRSLPRDSQLVILWLDIDGRPAGDCAFLMDRTVGQVMDMEDHAIRRMAGMLGGRRWGGLRPGSVKKIK